MSQTYIPAVLRRLVRERSQERCEYCLMPESATFAPHWIDHIIAEKHGGITDADNLANACILCNQRKGSDPASLEPDSGALVRLFHPRRDRWAEHLQLDNGRIEPLTSVGKVTVRLLRLNDPDRVAERRLLMEVGVLVPPAQ